MSSATPLFVAQNGYPYNTEKAKQLLKDAGFEKGFDVSVMLTAGNADQTAIASSLQQMWAQVGVRLKLEPLETATNRARYRAADFQLRVSAWTDDIADPSEITSYFADFRNIESLHSGFRSAEIEKLFDQSQKELNVFRRVSQYTQIQKIYWDQAPLIFLYEPPYPVALQSYVKDFVQIPLGNNIFVKSYLDK